MAPQNVTFDPDRHLGSPKTAKVYTMTDLEMPKNTGISSIAVSEPFELFTPEAVQIMRDEILRPNVWERHHFTSALAPSQLRGYAAEYTCAIHISSLRHPLTLDMISRIAGIKLVPIMDYEIGHVNLSENIKHIRKHSNSVTLPEKTIANGHDIAGKETKGNPAVDLSFEAKITKRSSAKPLVSWHKDAYPFVCVLSMSDPANIKSGGETILKTNHNPPQLLKIKPPPIGHAIVLQGRYITHAALPPSNKDAERITMVTSFRPADPLLHHECVLHTVKPNSNRDRLYTEYFEYKVDVLKARVDAMAAGVKNIRAQGKYVGIAEINEWCIEVEAYLKDIREQVYDAD